MIRTISSALLAIFVSFLLQLPGVALAQQGQPFPEVPPAQWDPNILNDERFATPEEACRRQWEVNNPSALFGGATPEDWDSYQCVWSGNGPLPAVVRLRCPTTWDLIRPGECVKGPEQRSNCRNSSPQSSTPTPTAGNPICLQSGSKIELIRDYATSDGLFGVDRFYHSNHRGR
jgi:hypothetical protein